MREEGTVKVTPRILGAENGLYIPVRDLGGSRGHGTKAWIEKAERIRSEAPSEGSCLKLGRAKTEAWRARSLGWARRGVCPRSRGVAEGTNMAAGAGLCALYNHHCQGGWAFAAEA